MREKIKTGVKGWSEHYQLDLGRYELRRANGAKVKIERQPMELLIFLAASKGRLVTREEMVTLLWPTGITVDTEPAINNAVRKIRTALRDSPDRPSYLETVVGKGYRFIGEIDVILPGAPAAKEERELALPAGTPPAQAAMEGRRHWSRTAMVGATVLILAIGAGLWVLPRVSGGPGRRIHSLAILPLQNLSGDSTQDYLAEGITDELTTNLANVGSLRVISRTSTTQYRAGRKPIPLIARELSVDTVLEGSVVRSGNRVRVTAQLIDARNDAHLWAQTYERDFGDILELEDAIALDIGSQVHASLSREDRGAVTSRHSVKPEAYEAYLHGRGEIAKQTQNGVRNSSRYFQQAIDVDPLFAAAYAGLADSFNLMANYGVLPPKEVFPRGEAAARRALELDPSSAEAHSSLAFAKHHFDWDWSGAEAEYRRAIQLSPGLAQSHLRFAEYLAYAGRHEEAFREISKARDGDPLSMTIASNVGFLHFLARRDDAAIRELHKVLQLDGNRRYAWLFLGMAYEQQQRYSEAITAFQHAEDLLGGPVEGRAHLYAVTGQAASAKRLLVGLETPDETGVVDWFFIAGVYAALGERDNAFAWLEKAYDNRDFFLTLVKVFPYFDNLRSDPRLAAIYKKIGLPQ